MIRRTQVFSAMALLAGLFSRPPDAGADFRLLVAEASDNIVGQVDASGSATTFAPGQRTPVGLAVDGSGDVYVANFGGRSVEKFSASGKDLGVFASGFFLPSDVAVDRAGNVYVLDYAFGRIEKFSASGQDLGSFAGFFGSPNRMAFDSAGNLYVTVNSEIDKFSPSGVQLASISLGFSASPVGLAISSSDVIYEADVAHHEIDRYSTAGVFLGRFAAAAGEIESLAFDPNGYLYASSALAGTIERYSPTGQDLGVFASGLGSPEVIAFASPAAVPEPSSLALCAIATTAGLALARGRRKVARVAR